MENFNLDLNYQDLREQKKALLTTIDYMKNNHLDSVANKLDGLLNLIDSIQDQAVDNLNHTEKEIFNL